MLKVGEENVDVYECNTKIGKVIILPGTWHFVFAKSKRMIITKNHHGAILIRCETAYSTLVGIAESVCRRGKNMRDMTPTVIPKKKKKKNDVNELLVAHYGENWRDNADLKFYQFVLDDAEERDQSPKRLCEKFDDGPNVAI